MPSAIENVDAARDEGLEPTRRRLGRDRLRRRGRGGRKDLQDNLSTVAPYRSVSTSPENSSYSGGWDLRFLLGEAAGPCVRDDRTVSILIVNGRVPYQQSGPS